MKEIKIYHNVLNFFGPNSTLSLSSLLCAALVQTASVASAGPRINLVISTLLGFDGFTVDYEGLAICMMDFSA